MEELKVIATAGSTVGALLCALIVIIKYIFKKDLTKGEKWIVFLLCYLPITFCLIFVVLRDDGGKQKESNKGEEQRQGGAKKSALSVDSKHLISFLLIPSANAMERSLITNVPQGYCGVEPKQYDIKLSFNDGNPWYVTPGDVPLRLVLQSIDFDRNVAEIEVNDDGRPIQGTVKSVVYLGINKNYDFNYKECKFRITNMGFGSYTEGLFLFFKTRHYVKIKLEKLQ